MKTTEIIEQIRERLDIVELVREYVPSLKKAGRTYKACCPFHNEKTPSFTVNQEKQFFYCFGCQEGGDAFAFLMKAENLSFNEAAERLAEKAGVEWRPQESLGPEEKERAEIKKAVDFAKRFFCVALAGQQGAPVRAYLAKRGISAATVAKFELGLAPDMPDTLVKAALKAGYSQAVLDKAGLISRGDRSAGLKDYFRARLMFPIANHRGETVGFGGRVLDNREPKYLNSPDTPVFSKSKVLYGLAQGAAGIRKLNRIMLVEGYMDTIACHQAGVGYAAAPLGTAVGQEHARLIKRYCEEAIMLFDPDPAGAKASLRGAAVLWENGVSVKIASLDGGLDPDEFIKNRGLAAFEKTVKQACDLVAFHTDLVLARLEKPLSAQDKKRAATELLDTVSKQPDPIIRSEWRKYLAERLEISENILLEMLGRGDKKQQTRAPGAPAQSAIPWDETLPAEERDILRYLLKLPGHAEVCDLLAEQDFKEPKAWAVLAALRKLPDPTPASVLRELAAFLPSDTDALLRLSCEELPTSPEPIKNLADCVRRLKNISLERQLKNIQKQLKECALSGKDTAALLIKKQELGKYLKSSSPS